MKGDYNSRLTIFVVVALIVIGGVIFANVLSFREIEKLTINQLLENKVTETKFAASQIETHINKVRDELVTLSKFPFPDSLDDQECKLDLEKIYQNAEEKLDAFLLTNKEGTVVSCSSSDYKDYY